jgi:Uma2 family endonuclease
VVRIGASWERIVTVPPLIAIEILSLETTLRRAEEKARHYLEVA